jgi:K+-transporting ATPase ATPase A chain
VGRTPEYLGQENRRERNEARGNPLAVHPLMILGPTGLFAATDWGIKAENNPGTHGFSEIAYQSRRLPRTMARPLMDWALQA